MIIIVHLFYQASSKRRNKRCRQYQKDLEMGRQRLKAERATCTFKATRTYQLHAVSLRVSQNQRVTANFNFQQPRVAYILTVKSHTPPRDRWTRGCSLLIFFFWVQTFMEGYSTRSYTSTSLCYVLWLREREVRAVAGFINWCLSCFFLHRP